MYCGDAAEMIQPLLLIGINTPMSMPRPSLSGMAELSNRHATVGPDKRRNSKMANRNENTYCGAPRCGPHAVKALPSPSQRFRRPEHKPEKVERLVRKVATAVRILAVDDLRLFRMQHQLAGREAILQRAP